MTAPQFRAAIDRLGLSQVEAGRVLGVTDRTVRRWVSGRAEVPAAVGKLLRLLELGKVSVEDLRP